MNYDRIALHCGDCRDMLTMLPDDSIDACVTDPPYALTSIVKRMGSPTAAPVSYGSDGRFQRVSGGFMGQKWDTGEVAHDPAFWAEVLRTLKPGAHLVAFGGTRTYHRMVCAIEDAGFEIRDQLAWLYASGFPKSHDVSKGIDRAGGINPREQAALLRQHREAAGLSRDDLATAIGCTSSSVRDWEEGRARAVGRAIEWIVPSNDYRAKLVDLLGYTQDERQLIGVVIDRRGDGSVIGLGHSGELRNGGNTDAAREWEGWGTALKPACEPICLARKPVSEGTVAANVLRWGTGAINVGGCRVAGQLEGNPTRFQATNGGWKSQPYGNQEVRAEGRWPANVLHDGSAEVVGLFPETAGQQGDIRGTEPSVPAKGDVVYGFRDRVPFGARNDSGSAARFFYSAKADSDDRLGSKHPTVKPVDLMQWLCRLVTPKGGMILDPFAGTGTTGEAAFREGFPAILIERDPTYQEDIRRRLRLLQSGPDERMRESMKASLADIPPDYGPLFAYAAE